MTDKNEAPVASSGRPRRPNKKRKLDQMDDNQADGNDDDDATEASSKIKWTPEANMDVSLHELSMDCHHSNLTIAPDEICLCPHCCQQWQNDENEVGQGVVW